MNLYDFLGHQSVQLPVSRGDEDFEVFVANRLAEYQRLLEELSEPTDVATSMRSRQSETDDICTALVAAIRHALSGQPSAAYGCLAAALDRLNPIFAPSDVKELHPHDFNFLYRMRNHVGPPLPSRGLFHIPFEERHKVATQRFSIPGLPCLYLGGSLYTCWAEMGRLPFQELCASAFWLKPGQTVKVVDLSHRPKRVQQKVNPNGTLQDPAELASVCGFLTMWPLLFLCSIIVEHRDAPFKVEYVIPQLVLQWVTGEWKVDGVCYASTHIREIAPRRFPLATCNLVFPAKDARPTGRCSRLENLFDFTVPQNWQLLSAVQLKMRWVPNVAPNYHLEFVGGISEDYLQTEFGRVEIRLNHLAEAALGQTQT